MVSVTQPIEISHRGEKDDPENFIGMQYCVWRFNNGTYIMVRFYIHAPNSAEKLYDGKRVQHQVNDLVAGFLQDIEVIQDTNNWHHVDQEETDYYSAQDCASKKEHLYFIFKCTDRDIASY